MIDFENAKFIKLRRVPNSSFESMVEPILITGETPVFSYQGIRDGIVFTNKRVIVINVKGVTGKQKLFASLPYNKIQLYSIETAGVFDIDSELDIWFAAAGKIEFEFTSRANVHEICKLISEHVL